MDGWSTQGRHDDWLGSPVSLAEDLFDVEQDKKQEEDDQFSSLPVSDRDRQPSGHSSVRVTRRSAARTRSQQ
ncbi:unnamed protein product [Lampetra planeri]